MSDTIYQKSHNFAFNGIIILLQKGQTMKNTALLKTVTWYFFHFAMVSLLGTLITSDWTTGVKLASAEMFVETILYYGHEKIWEKIKQWI